MNADGTVAFEVYRLDNPEGKRIWHTEYPPGLRPLYNLIRLNSEKEKPAILLFGEKKCVEAQEATTNFVVVTFSGGDSGYKKTDLTPLYGRSVTIWPDNDESSKKAAAEIARILTANGSKVRMVRVPAGKPKAWDIGNCLVEDPSEIRGLIDNSVPYDGEADTHPLQHRADMPDFTGWKPEEIELYLENTGIDPDLLQGIEERSSSPVPSTSPDTLLDEIAGRAFDGTPDAPEALPTTPPAKEKKKPASQALAEIAESSEAIFWHDEQQKTWASFPVGDHVEHSPINEKRFRLWLSRKFYEATKSAPNAQAMQDALGVLSARALFDGEEKRTCLRVAGSVDKGKILVDLCNSDWQTVAITADGWEVRDAHDGNDAYDAVFRRSSAMASFPTPRRGGSLALLKKYVNFETEGDFLLYVSTIFGCFMPQGPYAGLAINGEQGSHKSTTCRIHRKLTDPTVAEIRHAPRCEDDLFVMAHNGHVISIDNLSSIPPWLSDALSEIGTGSALSKRVLYEDSDECVLSVQRPLVLNGIPEVATRADLLDRVIALTLPQPEPGQHKEELRFWAEFEEDYPLILGAIFDCLSGALRNYGSIELPFVPRMADYFAFAAAAFATLGLENEFFKAFVENESKKARLVLDTPVARAVEMLMTQRSEWKGSSTALLEALGEITDDAVKRSKGWPTQPNVLSGNLLRLAPALRRIGYSVEFTRTAKERIVSISRRIGEKAVIGVTTVTKTGDVSRFNDARDDEDARDDDLQASSAIGYLDNAEGPAGEEEILPF